MKAGREAFDVGLTEPLVGLEAALVGLSVTAGGLDFVGGVVGWRVGSGLFGSFRGVSSDSSDAGLGVGGFDGRAIWGFSTTAGSC